jgi:hypothetical protein
VYGSSRLIEVDEGMGSLIRTAIGLISRKRRAVASAVALLVVPGLILPQIGASAAAAAAVGEWIVLAGIVVLQVVFLTEGGERSYSIRRVVTAVLKEAAAYLLLTVIAFLILSPVTVLVAVLFASKAALTLIVGAMLVALVVLALPIVTFLFPVCLDESGGPWTAVRATWKLCRPSWLLVYPVILACFCLGAPAILLRFVGGVGPVSASVVLSAVLAPVNTALLVALYLSLAEKQKAAIADELAVPRSRQTAAAGTFRQRQSKPARRRR